MDKIIYEKENFVIFRAKRGFVLYNTKKDYDQGHTHLKTFITAKKILNNVINKKVPRTNDKYIIQSHIRVSKQRKYKRRLFYQLEKKCDRQRYYNVQCSHSSLSCIRLIDGTTLVSLNMW